MARLPVISEEAADEQTKKIYDAIKSKFGICLMGTFVLSFPSWQRPPRV